MRKQQVSVYSKAVSLGYQYRFGEGKLADDGQTWLSRFQKTPDPDTHPVLYLGYDADRCRWVKVVVE